ncbi:MAG: 30S ribosome-binding factor RbfA, partial [Eggerthellaceae bacterium]|nr:30S ribosome-binding factor RbfA [Eggerthellaceae bacterium]
MKDGSANRKVNEQAREVVASILLFDLSDPRLRLVTITGCEVNPDRTICNIYYTCEPERYIEVEAAFDGAKGAIRSLMAKKLSWKQAPQLNFIRDERVDAAEKVTQYI